MGKILNFVGLAALSFLVACGGGGGNSGNEGPSKVAVVSVEVLTAAAELKSSDPTGVVISAIAKDAQNNALADREIVFSASSGVLSGATATTGSDGKATATLTAGNDKSNRAITVKVTAGNATGTVVLPVTGTSLSVAGVTSLLKGGSANYAVSVKDSGGAPIGNVQVTASSALGNTIAPASAKTDASGAASFAYTGTKGGTDTVRFSAAGATQTLAITVSDQDFVFVNPVTAAELAINQDQTVTVRYRSAGQGVAGKAVTFGTTRGGIVGSSFVQTDANGFASAVVRSTSAGRAILTAQLEGGTTASLPLTFVSVRPASVVLQTSAAALAPNASGSTVNQVELRAVVRDDAGNAVKGATVYFTAVKDLSGGSIKTGSSVTDENGVATDVFVSGAVSTAANGVILRATVVNPDPSKPAISSDALLTVNAKALFITIASNNTIEKLSTTYRKTFSVQVNDANGAPVPNQSVTMSYWAPWYFKGVMKFDEVWKRDLNTVSACRNEDLNRNGILDPGEEDPAVNGQSNRNGILEPGLPAVISPATVVTDAAGSAEFTITYGQQFAQWFQIDLTAKAIVAGTESSGVYSLLAPLAAEDATSETVAPAGYISPFGTGRCDQSF